MLGTRQSNCIVLTIETDGQGESHNGWNSHSQFSRVGRDEKGQSVQVFIVPQHRYLGVLLRNQTSISYRCLIKRHRHRQLKYTTSQE